MEKLYAVIGDPIAHSMSPVMHNDLFSFYGLAAHYEPIHIKKDHLEKGIQKLRDTSVGGFNVTIPHKTAIIPLLDEVDALAGAIGAVNTVVVADGKLSGYNTDGAGYVRGLQEIVPQLTNKKFLIIGAGGAARAIYFTLAHLGVESIDMTNRTKSKAEQLISTCPYKTKSQALSLEIAEKEAAAYDVIIQTTSIGMYPETNQTPFSVEGIEAGTIVSDIIYNPSETLFLQEAKHRGGITQNGLPMFVYQGALAFEKWTGIFPETKRMERTVNKELSKNSKNEME